MSTLEASKAAQKTELDAQVLRLQNEISVKIQEGKDLWDKVEKVRSEKGVSLVSCSL